MGDFRTSSRLTSITNVDGREVRRSSRRSGRFREFLGDAVMVAHTRLRPFVFLDFEFGGCSESCLIRCFARWRPLAPTSAPRSSADARRTGDHFGSSRRDAIAGLGDARTGRGVVCPSLYEMAAEMGLNRLDRLIDWNIAATATRERHVSPR